MLMIFNLQAQGDDSMMRMIIIIVVSLSVIGINFWLKSEKEKTIPKQKKRKIPRKLKVSINSKRHIDWLELKKIFKGEKKVDLSDMNQMIYFGIKGLKYNVCFNRKKRAESIQAQQKMGLYMNHPPKTDATKKDRDYLLSALNFARQNPKFSKLSNKTWDAFIKFNFEELDENQLDEIYKKNEIKSDAKKTVKAKKDKAPDWFDVEESESLWEVIEYNRTLLSGSMSIEEEEINRNSVGMVMLNIRKRKLAKLPVNYFEALLKYINSDISKEELDEIL